ncbi:MAG: rod shape-determining protein RodA [Phycisphaerae bacterium]|nr:rod shape-determining protein RodA [Phycisphaerae bacterium]
MLEGLRQYFRLTTWLILLAMLGLMIVGMFAIRASEAAEGDPPGFVMRQLIAGGVGLAAFAAAVAIPYRQFGRAAYPLFAVTLGLLALVLFLPPIRYSHRWIAVGPLQFQPSELAKLSLILMLAWYLRYRSNYRRLLGLAVPFALTFVPMVLILREPDLGTALLFLPTLYAMLMLAGARWVHLLGIVAVATALVLLPVPRPVPENADGAADGRQALAYATVRVGGQRYALTAAPLIVVANHQVERIDGWLRQGDPSVAMDQGYQLHQSKTALACGQLAGSGNWADADLQLSLLPDDHTDFIFAVVGGQWGFVGCVGILALYGVIFLVGIEIATATYDPFGRLLAVGVLGLLLAQIFINVGMTMGLMPITGMTLPFVSYGGSSLVINCVAMGLLVNVGLRRPILLGRHPFEHGQKRERPLAVRKMHAGSRASHED